MVKSDAELTSFFLILTQRWVFFIVFERERERGRGREHLIFQGHTPHYRSSQTDRWQPNSSALQPAQALPVFLPAKVSCPHKVTRAWSQTRRVPYRTSRQVIASSVALDVLLHHTGVPAAWPEQVCPRWDQSSWETPKWVLHLQSCS